MCQISINSEHFQFWDQSNMGLPGGKYLIKIVDIKIEINI